MARLYDDDDYGIDDDFDDYMREDGTAYDIAENLIYAKEDDPDAWKEEDEEAEQDDSILSDEDNEECYLEPIDDMEP